MKRSQIFQKTRRDNPADETSLNAKLLVRAGYVAKEMAGVYNYLPLGWKVINNIMQIIREEMNSLGASELQMSSLQDPVLWQATDEWDDEKVDVWFKTKLKSGGEVGIAYSHEAAFTNLVKSQVSSYRDLPIYLYQFQTKFRNEVRAKSGIMRTREFIMKDLYSFSKNTEAHDEFYKQVQAAYKRIFDRIGISEQTYLTLASGGSFAKFSHEFQTICPAGEDTVLIDEQSHTAINKDIATDEQIKELGFDKARLKEVHCAEVGNIFNLGNKYSKAQGLTYVDEGGVSQEVVMGSYGIGPGRVMGVVAELMSDDAGLVWPSAIAPAQVYLIGIGPSGTNDGADKLYKALQEKGIETIFDDRDVTAGEKFGDADLLGIPWRVVVSEKTITAGGFELKARTEKESRVVTEEELLSTVKK